MESEGDTAKEKRRQTEVISFLNHELLKITQRASAPGIAALQDDGTRETGSKSGAKHGGRFLPVPYGVDEQKLIKLILHPLPCFA